ncbi:MAG: hypothetical protein LBQ50_01945 [Planctomycetaceae bacterium]|jgi:hypothetical protein|nr:hypothetical protein [Planctomycetaceae bacterium]
MFRTIIVSFLFCLLFFSTVFADNELVWKFSNETIRLFAPPMDATAQEMLKWAERLEKPFPSNTDKWGGFEKFRKHVAMLRIDIADQIIFSKTDDHLFSMVLSGKWFPYLILIGQGVNHAAKECPK